MHTLNMVSPFDFQKSLAFLGGFSPMRGEQALGLELRKATRLGGKPWVLSFGQRARR